MKSILHSSMILLVSCIMSCTPQSKTQRTVLEREDASFAKDSIEYYETDFEARQKNYREWLIGTWVIDTMRRQSQLPAETLSNVFIRFSDSTFTGNAGCNHISGLYILKGTSIIFSNIISTKMACPNLEQEYALLNLLQQTVSAYTVTDKNLLLRDGASNVIFSGVKKDQANK